MCGIVASVNNNDVEVLTAALRRRGPDSMATIEPSPGVVVGASVLGMRRTHEAQPVALDGVVVAWNGEWYAGGPSLDECDTAFVARLVKEAAEDATSAEDARSLIAESFMKVRGEYALIAWIHKWRLLVYGRDPVGRRSLVRRDDRFMVASVALDGEWHEVDPGGLHGVTVETNEGISQLPDEPWPLSAVRRPPIQGPEDDDREVWAASALTAVLSEAVRRRVVGAERRVAVLFSGGLDSAVLAALAHKHCPPQEPIELINVAFGASSNAPDRLAARKTLRELETACPNRDWRLVEVDVDSQMIRRSARRIVDLVKPSETHMDFNIAAVLRHAAHGVGRLSDGTDDDDDDKELLRYGGDVPGLEKLHEAGVCPAVYSRGGDRDPTACTNRRQPKCARGLCGNCCRRQGGCSVHPHRRTLEEKKLSHKAKQEEVKTKTEAPPSDIDEDGFLTAAEDSKYRCLARVLLLGMGADELFAGYARHRTVWRRDGAEGLQKELDLELARIGHRNLGRDDRVIGDAAKEARFPYLDEDVINLVRSFRLTDIANLDLPPGIGSKLVLRNVARRLGLPTCATLQKRAIQFGTRIAGHSNRLAFGSNHRANGSARFSVDAFLAQAA